MEIGSEFNLRLEELEQTKHSIYHKLNAYNTCYLDSGRSAIKLLLKVIPKGEVLLPEYICNSVIEAFKGFDVKYYRLLEDLSIDIDDLGSKVNDNTRAVFLMHYLGAIQPIENLIQIRDMKKRNDFMIIEDTTHSLFSILHTVGDYCICSLRKWFAIPDGGVLYSTKSFQSLKLEELTRNTRIEKAYGMMLKTLYLDGKIGSNLIYRKILVESEKEFDKNQKIQRISRFSEYLLKCYNTEDLVARRKENYSHLLNEIKKIGLKPLVKVEDEWCPFVLPIKTDGRDRLREYLIENRVYCAVHWPLDSSSLYENLRSRKLSERILSLPIDQRYGSDEISYLASVLKNYEESIECR